MSIIESIGLDVGAVVALPPGNGAAVVTVADLLERLDGVPPERVRLVPTPGTATEQDAIDLDVHEDRLFELVDGTLVEKAMGFFEDRLGATLIFFIERYLEQNAIGFTVGSQAMTRFAPGLVRMPDVSFIRWDRMPGGQVPRDPISAVPPDLAVEVLSPSNTRREMERKLREYFAAGVRLVWYVDPETRTVTEYTSPTQSRVLNDAQSLEGGDVLPGFSLSIAEWFAKTIRPLKA